jgi:acyl-coenzyme A synthetase/AMP-(fatty) acid ligase
VVQVLERGGGEVVAAVVVLASAAEATEAEILAYGWQHLTAHQAPTLVRFVDRLPRNSVGKLLRARLHALLAPASPT